MKWVSALALAVALLAVAAFCLFGFLATYEPPAHPTLNLTFRFAYALLGAAAAAGALGTLARIVSRSK